MNQKDFLIGISAFESFGPQRTKLLLKYFNTPKNVWSATKKDLMDLKINPKIVDNFLRHKLTFNIPKYLGELSSKGIKTLIFTDPDYPENLKSLHDSPMVLYVRGEINKADSMSVAIVGTRMMTSYGREVAQKLSAELAGFGITIISGLALGVDSEAQRSALKAGGRTISVLASGVDIITPITNKQLAMEIINGRGAVVSEYPLGHIPKPFEFPVRDRLISGMAKAVIVVEGRMNSGTFHTVNAATNQGRAVFAVPGPITSPTSEAPNYLIKNGAVLVTAVKDILEELDLQFKVDLNKVNRVVPSGKNEAKILDFLNSEPLHIDELARISGLQMSEISATLTVMEMKGMVKSLGSGEYKKL